MNDALLRHTSMLRAEGWSDRQIARALREGTLVREVRGIYGSGGQTDVREAHLRRARAMLMRQGDAVVVSHVSAALAHGLPVDTRSLGFVHLTVAPPGFGRRRSGYHTHTAPLAAEDVTEIHGLRVTSLTRTVADVVRSTPFTWGVIAADQGLARGVRRHDLLRIAEMNSGRTGVAALRKAAGFADPRSQSPAESASRVTMARAGIPKPELQWEVIGDIGWVATSDFGWPDLGVVGEVDGAGKYGRLLRPGRTPEATIMAEKDRDEAIRQAGWWPTRWGWTTAWNVQELGDLIRGAFSRPSPRRRSCRE